MKRQLSHATYGLRAHNACVICKGQEGPLQLQIFFISATFFHVLLRVAKRGFATSFYWPKFPELNNTTLHDPQDHQLS